MILTAHQPVYLPWLGLFHKIALAETFCLFEEVQYLKRDWNNRNKIKTANGVIWLTVPVHTKGHRQKTIKEIEINNTLRWKEKHWKSIRLAYCKSQYWKEYADFFEDMYKRDWIYLARLAEYQICNILKFLGISVMFTRDSQHNFTGKSSTLVLSMCKDLGASTYIFGAMGNDYAQQNSFDKAGIKLHFQDYHHPVYPQLYGDFVSHLSIIDLLFNVGGSALEVVMSGNVSKKEIEMRPLT